MKPEFVNRILINNFKLQDTIKVIPDSIGESNAHVFIIHENDKPVHVLKVNEDVNNLILKRSVPKLNWMKGKLPVPDVIDYHFINNIEYLLTNYYPGIASFTYGQNGGKNCASILGTGLRQIHSLSVDDWIEPGNITGKFEMLFEKIASDKVNVWMKEQYFPGQSNDEIIKTIRNLMPEKWDPVFSHGDYCLPNILIHNDKLSAFIDLGDCGISDRYHDLYFGVWSLNYNKLAYLIPEFLKNYGIDKVNTDRITLFAYLEELLWE